MSAGTMKMPEPIIEPMTIAVAENSPIPCTNCGCDAGEPSDCFSEIFTLQSVLSQMEEKVSSHSRHTLVRQVLMRVIAKKRKRSGAQKGDGH